MVSTRESPGHSAALRRLFGAAALLGLFAMHGLAAHGTAHDGHPGEPMAVVTEAGQHQSGHVMTSEPPADASGMTSASGEPEPEDGLFGLAGMCLAVLLVGVILSVLLGRRHLLARQRDAALRAVGWPRRSRRDRDPPCLFALSIQRC